MIMALWEMPFRDPTSETHLNNLACRCIAVGLFVASSLTASVAWSAAPSVALANVYVEGRDPAGYLVSEKLDGVRGYWAGTKLLTRGGTIVNAPAWFTAGWR